MLVALEGVAMVITINPEILGDEIPEIPTKELRELAKAASEHQSKCIADAKEFLDIYWRGHDAKARKHTLTLAPMEEWLDANQPLDRWFFVHLIEAAGAKAIELGYSQYKSDIAKGKNAALRNWVLEAWNNREDKGQGKESFSRMYATLVKKKFDLNITAGTIARARLRHFQSWAFL